MLKEVRVIPVYPEDKTAIETTVKTYELFGWHLVSNNSCEELDDTNTVFATFNKLTFQRDKENPLYFEFANLENRYNEAQAHRTAFEMMGGRYTKEYVKAVTAQYGLQPRFNWCAFILGTICAIVPGIIYCVKYNQNKRTFYERQETMTPQDDILREIEHEINDIVAAAQQLTGRVPNPLTQTMQIKASKD